MRTTIHKGTPITSRISHSIKYLISFITKPTPTKNIRTLNDNKPRILILQIDIISAIDLKPNTASPTPQVDIFINYLNITITK